MSADRITDGHRIAQLLASELESGASHDALAVTDADPDVEPTPEGALAYRVLNTARDEPIATVYVQPDRVRVEFRARPRRSPTPPRSRGSASAPRPASRPGRSCSSRTARR